MGNKVYYMLIKHFLHHIDWSAKTISLVYLFHCQTRGVRNVVKKSSTLASIGTADFLTQVSPSSAVDAYRRRLHASASASMDIGIRLSSYGDNSTLAFVLIESSSLSSTNIIALCCYPIRWMRKRAEIYSLVKLDVMR